jgi:hypothetical protein
MGTDLATVKGFSREQILAGLATTTQESQAQLWEYLQFDGRAGRFKLSGGGKGDNEELPLGTKLVLNLVGSKKGYVCWVDKQVVGQHIQDMFSALPPISALEDHGPYTESRDGWALQYSLMLKDMDSGKQYNFKINSASGTRAVGALIQDVLAQFQLKRDPLTEYPVISLGAESFKSKGFSNYKPVFEIVDWKKLEESELSALPAPAPQSGPEIEDENMNGVEETSGVKVATRKRK